jgi:hypothetical protein
VAKVRLGYHDANKIPGEFLSDISKGVFEELGAKNISGGISSGSNR